MIELVAVEVEAADEGQQRAVGRAHGDECGFDLRDLGDAPASFVFARHANDGAGPDPGRCGRFVAQRRGGKLESVARDLERFAIGDDDLDRGGGGFENHRRNQPVTLGRVLEYALQRGLAFARVVRQAHESLGSPIAMAPVVIDRAAPQRGIRRLLIGLADCRVDDEPPRVGVFAVGVEHDLAGHFGHVLGMRRDGLAQTLPYLKWRALCFPKLVIVDKTEVVHAPQDVKLTGFGAPRVVDGIEGRRGLGQAGQHRCLCRRHFLERLAKIDLGRRREAIGPLTEKDLVHVELENLVLGQIGFDLPREQDLTELSGNCLFAGQEEVPGDLHRDGAGALLCSTREIACGSAQDTEVVDAPMRIETLIFGSQNGLFHHIGHFGDSHDRPALLPEFAQEVALGRDDPQGDLGLVVGQAFERWQGGIKQRQHEGDEQPADDRQAKQDGPDVEKPPV